MTISKILVDLAGKLAISVSGADNLTKKGLNYVLQRKYYCVKCLNLKLYYHCFHIALVA